MSDQISQEVLDHVLRWSQTAETMMPAVAEEVIMRGYFIAWSLISLGIVFVILSAITAVVFWRQDSFSRKFDTLMVGICGAVFSCGAMIPGLSILWSIHYTPKLYVIRTLFGG